MPPNYKKTLKQLKEEVYEKESEDLIFKMFEDRKDDLNATISKNEDYQWYSEKMYKIDDEISRKYKNFTKITNLFEEYATMVYCSEYISEKLMYKYGIIDGIILTINSLKKNENIKEL